MTSTVIASHSTRRCAFSASFPISAPTRGIRFLESLSCWQVGIVKHVRADSTVRWTLRAACMLVVLRFLRGVKLACDRAVAPILSDSTLHGHEPHTPVRCGCGSTRSVPTSIPTMIRNLLSQSSLEYTLSTLQTVPPLLLSLLCLC